jgi:hypothetical protein
MKIQACKESRGRREEKSEFFFFLPFLCVSMTLFASITMGFSTMHALGGSSFTSSLLKRNENDNSHTKVDTRHITTKTLLERVNTLIKRPIHQ